MENKEHIGEIRGQIAIFNLDLFVLLSYDDVSRLFI